MYCIDHKDKFSTFESPPNCHQFHLFFLTGGFTYFKGCSTQPIVTQKKEAVCYGSLKSPWIFAGARWKCLQFWYYLGNTGYTSLEVTLISNETQWIAWTSTSYENNVGIWSYARFAIDSMTTSYQVNKMEYLDQRIKWNNLNKALRFKVLCAFLWLFVSINIKDISDKSAYSLEFNKWNKCLWM